MCRSLEREFRRIFVRDCACISGPNVSTRSNTVSAHRRSIRTASIRAWGFHLNEFELSKDDRRGETFPLTNFGHALVTFVDGRHRSQIFHLSIECDASGFGQTGAQRPVQRLEEVTGVNGVVQRLTDGVVRLKKTFQHVAQLRRLIKSKTNRNR